MSNAEKFLTYGGGGNLDRLQYSLAYISILLILFLKYRKIIPLVNASKFNISKIIITNIFTERSILFYYFVYYIVSCIWHYKNNVAFSLTVSSQGELSKVHVDNFTISPFSRDTVSPIPSPLFQKLTIFSLEVVFFKLLACMSFLRGLWISQWNSGVKYYWFGPVHPNQ